MPLPLPPPELRYFVGPLDDESYDNPTGNLVFDGLPASAYDTVFDFGCGCGRLARRLMQQRPQPRRYVGVDLNRLLVDWCRTNLTPAAPHFEFHHHDVYNAGFNPTGVTTPTPLPIESHAATLMLAWSVFTHLVEAQAVFYLREARRALRDGGILLSTWFLFEKRDFPMLHDFQNALYVNDADPTNAVIFDKDWLRRVTTEAGLTIVRAEPPAIRGYQWELWMRAGVSESGHVHFPQDTAPYARLPPPASPIG